MESRDRGAAFQTVLFFVLVVGVLGAVAAYVFGYVVLPGYVGVRQITIGPFQGFSERGLAPGYHWSIPGYSRFHFVPQTIQTLNLDRRNQDGQSPGALEIQTQGSSVVVDVSVLYRFFPDPVNKGGADDHGGPAELIKALGTERSAWVAHIQTAATNELNKALSGLSTSQFYEQSRRQQQVALAEQELRRRLAPVGIGVEGVLIRRYTYADGRIDRGIYEKNLQDQEEQYNRAASQFAKVRAEVAEIEATWDAEIKTLKVGGENKARVILSEGQLYETEKKAEGDLEIAKAQAQIDRLRAGVLAESAGANIYVAREIAPLLQSLRGGIVSGLDPYDLKGWMKRFGYNADGQK